MVFWRTRMLLKLLVSILPLSYKFWADIGLFRHGRMDNPECAWDVLTRHYAVIENKKNNWRGLELGPGDGILSALLAPALGSAGVTMVDAGPFAHRDAKKYKVALQSFILDHPDIPLPNYSQSSNDIESLLGKSGGTYLTEKMVSLRSLPDRSMDLIWSEAVLEHVRSKDFRDTIREMRRIISDDGIMSHIVDFKDHLGGKLNNLRFPSWIWECEWFASRAGFYTNRYSLSQIAVIFEDCGFDFEFRTIERWTCPPIGRRQLAQEFSHVSDDDLCVKVAHLIARPRRRGHSALTSN